MAPPPCRATSSLVSTLALVRASWGADAASVPDAQVDEHVAALLVKESKEKEERWRQSGHGHYNNPTTTIDDGRLKPGPTNKRFLKSVIRNVNGHNEMLRQQEEEEHSLSHQQRRTNIDPERLVLRAAARTLGNKRRRDDQEVDVNEEEEMKRLRSSRRHGQVDERQGRIVKESNRRKSQSSSSKKIDTEQQQQQQQPLKTGSKMDKYFDPSYNPRFDFSIEDFTNPTTGFIDPLPTLENVDDDDWKVVLDKKERTRQDQLREKEQRHVEKETRRRERKVKRERRREEKRRLKGKEKSKRQDDDQDTAGQRARSPSQSSSSTNPLEPLTHAQRQARLQLGLLDVEDLHRKGLKIREWDMGKPAASSSTKRMRAWDS